MAKTPKKRRDKRITISLAQVVMTMAVENMEERGFNENFSAYIADLIRRDREREEARKAGKPSTFPRHNPQHLELNEPAPKPKPPGL